MPVSARPAGWAELMAIGRAVIDAERIFGDGSPEHARQVDRWRACQRRYGHGRGQ
jgi:hypothetical protein